ncbi:MAG: GNAT family N-acetyltransferase [Coxiella sp. RIFCSPHIGHO2_12_FULL_44_14]|nr:MAG: GNAT family N-acetyltransferase [Coxiella sp. RIFCSPHIGHO2_12_FULL_44_14]
MINSFYHAGFPILEIDEEFVLREQTLEDCGPFFEYYTDPEVARYILATNPRNLSEASAEIHYCRSLFRYKCGIYWALARKEDNCMIGAVGLYINNQHYRAELCYDMARDYWNKGIMGKALRCVVDFSLMEIGLHRIEAITVKENGASVALLKKLGFHHEGSLRNYRHFNGKSHNVEMFAMTHEYLLQESTIVFANAG